MKEMYLPLEIQAAPSLLGFHEVAKIKLFCHVLKSGLNVSGKQLGHF